METSKVAPNPRTRRRGVVVVYVALTLLVMLGASALAVDAGYMYTRRAQAQKAADAAALAGAYQLSFIGGTLPAGVTRAMASARQYATANSYTDDAGVTTTVVPTYPVGGNSTWFKVNVQRKEPLFFSRALGFTYANIGATAIATFITPSVDIPIPTNLYGQGIITGGAALPWNYSIYGPAGLHSFGDNISTRLLDNGTANPEYTAPDNGRANALGGYNFIIKNNNMSNPRMQVELYDPDCFNANDSGGDDYGDNANVDELHSSRWLATGEDRRTVTQYSLYSDNGTPDDFTDDIFIARHTSDNSNANDLAWMTPAGFTFNKALYAVPGKVVNFRLNVATTSGSSENAFSLRAGPPHTTGAGAANTPFNAGNGTSVAIRSIIPINFNNDGAASFPLGLVSSAARGGTLTITKFDTDISANYPPTPNSVYYTCSAYGSTRFNGVVNMTSDAVTTDTITLPASYPGGTWTAHYTAGWGDTSTWRISATGGAPGSISLVR